MPTYAACMLKFIQESRTGYQPRITVAQNRVQAEAGKYSQIVAAVRREIRQGSRQPEITRTGKANQCKNHPVAGVGLGVASQEESSWDQKLISYSVKYPCSSNIKENSVKV